MRKIIIILMLLVCISFATATKYDLNLTNNEAYPMNYSIVYLNVTGVSLDTDWSKRTITDDSSNEIYRRIIDSDNSTWFSVVFKIQDTFLPSETKNYVLDNDRTYGTFREHLRFFDNYQGDR